MWQERCIKETKDDICLKKVGHVRAAYGYRRDDISQLKIGHLIN